MRSPVPSRLFAGLATLLALGCAPWASAVVAPTTPTGSPGSRPLVPRVVSGGAALDAAWAADEPAWAAFRAAAGGTWSVRVDAATLRPAVAAGSGWPLLPGPGNDLTAAEIGWSGDESPTLERVEALVRSRFLEPHAALFRVDPADLLLDLRSSASLLDGRVWTLDFLHAPGGVPVEGASVGVRINSGNLVLFGAVGIEAVAPAGAPAWTAEQALDAARRALGGAAASGPVDVLEAGTLLRVRRPDAPRAPHALAWRVRFSFPGLIPTWEARVDAATGAVLSLHDANDYQCEPRSETAAQVVGGVLAVQPSDPEVLRPLPFTTLTEDGVGKVTDWNGDYAYDGGSASSGLPGRYFATSCTTCTNPAAAFAQDDVTGRLDFGLGGNNDDGNGFSTRAERTTYYQANLIRHVAAKWYDPGTVPWLDTTVPARVNIDSACNAFWNGVGINFFHAAGGCGNTGEVAGVIQHEWGHGMDQATGRAGDGARGEGVGDIMDLMVSHEPEIGPGFRNGGGGVRCVDWRTCDQAPGPLGTPLTASNVASYCPPGGGTPLGRQVHCEGGIYGQTSWDLSVELVARFGQWGGWHVHESIFFPALLPTTTYLPDGPGGSFWNYLVVDDDDGDLTNGTPHAGEIFAAFDLHEIAPADCATDPACPTASSPACPAPAAAAFTATPRLSPTDGSVAVELAWDADPAVDHWRVYRTDLEEDDGYFLVADELTATSYLDGQVTNGLQYWYVVQPVGPGGCAQPRGTPVSANIALPELVLDSVLVSDAVGGDGDGVVEPGETVALTLVVRNVGATTATLVSGALTSGDPALVAVTVAATTWPDVPAGESRAPDADFEVNIGAGRFDCGSRVPLSVLIESADGCFTVVFALEIGSGLADARVAGWTVDDAAAGGNANGRPEPGESFDLHLELENAGPATVTAGELVLRTADPRVSVLQDLSTVGPLDPGVPLAIDRPFRLLLDSGAACPDEIEVELSLVGAEGCWTELIRLPVGRTRVIFSDDFESDRGWTWGEPFEPAALGAWTRGVPNGVFDGGRPWQPGAAAEGLSCAVTGNETLPGNPEHGDLDFETSFTSPVVDLTGEEAAQLSYRWWLAKSRPGDLLELQARVGVGPWRSLRIHDVDSPAWSQELVDLPAELGLPLGSVQLRFRAVAESPDGALVEAAIDDLRIAHVNCEAPEGVPGLALASLRLDDGSGLFGHGNGDGVLDPGESASLIPELTNVRNADALNVSVELRLIEGPVGLELLSPTATAPDLAPGAFAETDAPHFRMLIPESARCGAELVCELVGRYEDALGNARRTRLGTSRWSIGAWSPAPCNPFVDRNCAEPIVRIGRLHDFEGGSDGGWAHGILRDDSVLPGNEDDWQRRAPVELAGNPAGAYEGARVFGTDLRAGPSDAAYEASTHTFLESPAWDASRHAHVHLRYARWLSVQGSDFDAATVEVNGTEVWRNEPGGPLVDGTCIDPFGAQATWFGDGMDTPDGPAGWKLVEHEVSAEADHQPSVSARWRLRTDRQCQYGGWNLDAVELLGVPDRVACNAFAPCSTPLVVAPGPPGTLTCSERSVTLSGSVASGDGSFGYDYAWSPTAGLSDAFAAVTQATLPGTYTLSVRDRATGCRSSAAVVVDERVEPPVVRASQDGPITCGRPEATLSAEILSGDGSQGYAYSWSPAGPLADPFAATTTTSAAGNFICTVTDVATGCQASTVVTVASDTRAPRAEAGPVQVSVCFGEVTLDGSAFGGNGSLGFAFSWEPAANLDEPSSPSPSTNVPGEYVLTVTDLANGCTASDSAWVADAGDRSPPAPTGNALRVFKEALDVVLDLSRYPADGTESFDLYRSLRTDVLDDAGLDRTSPYLWVLAEPGPLLRDAGALESDGETLVCYRVHVVSACGLESP